MIKIILAVLMIILMFILILILNKKYKLTKEQQIIFILLVLFWTSITTIRAFRKTYPISSSDIGGLNLYAPLAIEIAAAYGLASFILRLPLFIFSDIFKKRKIFIQIAILGIVITSILVFIKPNFYTLYYSSLFMGVCASMLAIFNVIFSDTFKHSNAAVSASILSIAPLMSEMIAAPIQYIFTYSYIKNYKYLWLISSIFAIITFILSFMFKETNREKQSFNFKKIKCVTSNISFIYFCIIGLIISFIRFSTTGANMINYATNILNMKSVLVAYLDTVFTLFQLISSILVGTYFVKKIGLEKTLMLSLTLFSIFLILIIIKINPNLVFIAYSIAGFAYGLAYTSLISIALSYFNENHKNISMGIFQGFFSFGIFYADKIYISLIKILPDNLLNIGIYYIAIILCFICILLIFLTLFTKKKID